MAAGWVLVEGALGSRLGADDAARVADPGNGLAIAAGSLGNERLVGYAGGLLDEGRSIGTIGSRFIGTIFATRSSRSLQRLAEEVLVPGEACAAGVLGISDVLGVAGGGGKDGATVEAGSSVAPLGGRTNPLFGEALDGIAAFG